MNINQSIDQEAINDICSFIEDMHIKCPLELKDKRAIETKIKFWMHKKQDYILEEIKKECIRLTQELIK